MKVLFISNDPLIFDATSSVRARMREYATHINASSSTPSDPTGGGELHIISRAPFSSKEEQDGALYLHPYHGSKLSALFLMPRAARALITRYGIEIVSAQDPFEYGWIAAQAIQGTSTKLHIQIHTDFLSPWFTKNQGFRSLKVRMPLLNRVRVRISEKVLPKANGIRVVSKRIKDSLVIRYGPRIPEPVVIPVAVSGIVPDAVALPEHHFAFALLTASRLEPEKRIEDILMALGRIAQSYPSVGLFIVGEGRERKHLEELTRKLGLSSRVVFLGWRTDVGGLLRSASAYIQASAYEGYSRTLVEAALARIPTITTDVGIVGEVFRGYEEVLSAPVGDPAALSVHIKGLVDDHQARMLLGMNAERAAKEHLATSADTPQRIALDLQNTLSQP